MAQAALHRIESLYGGAFSARPGVVHVAAVSRGPDGALDIMKIEPDTPKSDADVFALSLSRARADAILTTGAIFRAEPMLRVEPFGPLASSLLALRASWGHTKPPALLVLTRGDLDLSHPGLHAWVRPIAITDAAGAARLRAQSGDGPAVHIVEMSVPTAAAAITWARENLSARTISVEAGPSTALTLYDPLRVDELMLSILEAEPPPHIRGRPFLGLEALRAKLGAPRSNTDVDEASGRWRIQRWIRGDASS